MATGQLSPRIYEELRRLARSMMIAERTGHTLDPTGLVHEAYLRLVDANQADRWNSRGHFFAAASEAMRRILIEQARRRMATKRGGSVSREPLDETDK